MPEPEVATAVRELVARRAALASGAALPDDLPLASGGLGLDSIALVELLLDCEERFGATGAAELLAGPPLTVGGLLAHVLAGHGR